MIRISTANAFADSVATLQRRQQEMSDAQARLTSGRKTCRLS